MLVQLHDKIGLSCAQQIGDQKLVIGVVLHPRWESDRQRKISKLLAGFVPKVLVAMVARVMFQSRLEGGAGLNVGMVVTNCRPSSTNRPEHEPGSHQTSSSKVFRPVWPWTASLPLRDEPTQIFYDVDANPFNWSSARLPVPCLSYAFVRMSRAHRCGLFLLVSIVCLKARP